MNNNFDVIVIGAGHAGCEAALATARMGLKTALFTINLDKIAEMSCNPAIGGLAKGQLVREIDALGGEMAKAADATCIQFKVLNSKKGPAVRGLRAQADKIEYSKYFKNLLKKQDNLTLIESMVDEITTNDNGVTGIITSKNEKFSSRAVIVSTGTFLNGVIHIGLESFPGGRRDDPPSVNLSNSLKKLGLKLGRLKTGTNPRVDKNSLDFSKFIPQYGDEIPTPFSFTTEKIEIKQVICYLTRTNEKTNKVISENLDRSPLYSKTNKKIFSIGPRYCPSIEDKVVKFPEKTSHQVFIEPEWRDSDELYLNGLSTSLPLDVQYAYLKTIPGFENVKIVKPGYGIEYDFVFPTQIFPTLEVKSIPGLYLAGQINGTSGYEEAAAQGLIAGINAAAKIKKMDPLILDRSQAYIGVMIDDLTTQGVTEPYRLFSSRAEYRLILRNDNADFRLIEYGKKYGLINDEFYSIYLRKKEFYENEIRRLNKTIIHPSKEIAEYLESLGTTPIKEPVSLLSIFKRPELSYNNLKFFTEIKNDIYQHFIDYLEAEVKYEGYIKKQNEEIEKFKKLESKKIPDDFDYYKFSGFSKEAQQKLSQIRPKTIGQASRIPGVTPADVNVLIILLKKYDNQK
ncbi:MAG: tRNA uridine-5-carboxymethylaminomethyl(34) synthesis enzyme MnmG [Candidatus Goldbacteria bacterium]|nr:tRNA uridine-5-carboxymethylaminomethyl(34) synthesis enzyme MnmG [Candidatus Goldiibacteriota bacterium]